MPHVAFLNRVYPPASGATGALLSELAPALVGRGWRVTVVTGPADGAPASEVTDQNVRVERVQGLSFSRGNKLRRALAYGSLFPALFARTLQLPSPDVIVTKTDPPMLKVLGPLLGRLTGARVVHWAQDLYPEVAEGVGVIPEGGALAQGLRRLSTWALRGHDHVVTVGRHMRERLVQGRGLRGNAVSKIPNWPPAVVAPVAHEKNPFQAKHDLEDRFVIMYSGNMGLAHPFGVLLDAAARLQETVPEACILFVGNGPRKAPLQQEVGRRGLSNVRFLPFQPREHLDRSLSAADLHLVTMQNKLSGLVVPSKLYGALGAGRPVLFLGPEDSEAARMVEAHDCGTVHPDPSARALARTIEGWHQVPDRWTAACQRARGAVDEARAKAVRRFDTLFWDVLQQDAASQPAAPPAAPERSEAHRTVQPVA